MHILLITGGRTKEASRGRHQPSHRPASLALAGRRLPPARQQGEGQEAFPPSDQTRSGSTKRRRLRRLSVDGSRRSALHRSGGASVGVLERQHDGQGQMVLPPGRD